MARRCSSAWFRGRAVALALLLAATVVQLHAQDPADSADRPPGNINELTLAGIQPGLTPLADVTKRLGPHWAHPSADETNVYQWCDRRTGIELRLEADVNGVVDIVNVSRALDWRGAPPGRAGRPAYALPVGCSATLTPNLDRTGRGIRLGASVARLLSVYGKPFFAGPSSWQGRDVRLVVFNFSWAGTDKPQILESTFFADVLVKMTLSAQYY